MTYRGLVLDFGGVLTTPLLPAVLAFERREALPEGAVINALYLDPESTQRTHDLERGAITQYEWNIQAAKALGADAGNLMGRIFADLRPEPAVIGAAAAARRAGVKVGILSNSVGLEPWDLYEGYELEERYDAVVISEHYRMRKPEPEMFAAVLGKLGLAAGECVFVDDTASYLPAAEKLGFATVHAQEPKKTIAQMEALLGIPLTQEV